MVRNKSVFYGLLAGTALLFFYIGILTLFENFNFAVANFRSLWYWIIPLSIGFGTQIGLYASIMHTAKINAEVSASGGVSGGSMIACCAHFILNAIPILGLSGLATFLMAYQKVFFSVGIVSNVVGISILLNHRKKMKGGEF